MPLITRPPAPPAALPRHHAARLAFLSLLLMANSAGPAWAAGPTPGTPASSKAGTAAANKAATPARATAAPRAKPATPRQQLKSEAEATATVETITEAQLNVAMRVLTGQADCEFNEHVTVSPMDGQPGHFLVGHKGLRYTMVPEETTTGAVRLVDRRAGVVWLQIPVKSMLMNSKLGRRMVDACTHAEQRAAVTAVAEAGAGLGIVPAATGTTAGTPAGSGGAAGVAAAAVLVGGAAAMVDRPAALAVPAAPAAPAAAAEAAVPAAPASAPR